jgi:pimeloyl-ACP methyl ester carboxylesterase
MPLAEVGDHRVNYEEHGEGVPLLLVAGLAADHRAWGRQVEAFSRHYRTIVFDNPGIGQTEGPDVPLSTALLADVAAGLLRRLGIDGAHVVGASMGGTIAQELALRHPELVRTLSLHSTWGRADNHLAAVMRSWQTSARALPFLDLCRQIWLWTFTVWFYNDRGDELRELERLVAAEPDLQAPEAFCRQADACIDHDALDRLGQVRVPTYMSAGDRDALTPAHHAYRIKERMPEARLRVWQQMAHAPFAEIPDEFNARQLEFLEAHRW